MARVPTPTRFVSWMDVPAREQGACICLLGLDPADACTVAVPRQSWYRNIHGALGSDKGMLQAGLAAAAVLETRLAGSGVHCAVYSTLCRPAGTGACP